MEVDGLEGNQQQQQPNQQDQQPQSQPAPSTRACELAKYLDMAVQRMKAVGPSRFFAEEVRPWEGCVRDVCVPCGHKCNRFAHRSGGG